MAARAPQIGCGGSSLVEVMVACAILGLVMGSLVQVSTGSHAVYQETSFQARLDERSRQALERMATELGTTGLQALFPDPASEFGTDDLTFAQVEGFTDDASDWGAPLRLAFEYEPGELDDDIDNDGNGLIDEGMIVLTRNVGAANELRLVLCKRVREMMVGELVNGADDNGNGVRDERGFNLQRVGGLLLIRLCVEDRSPTGATSNRSVQTNVRLRNTLP